jgi:hypothetical protein
MGNFLALTEAWLESVKEMTTVLKDKYNVNQKGGGELQ